MLDRVYATPVSMTNLTNTGFNEVSSLSEIFTWIVNLVIGAGWSIVIIMVAMGFLQYAMSQGDKSKVETAQKWLTFAVVGGLGLALVTAIRALIAGVSGGDINVEGVTIVE